ncbi:MAG: hypothetical protein ABI981_04900 [Betaproteobacteria bacterium]
MLFIVHIILIGVGSAHLLSARIYDVAVGCALALAGTLLATYPRLGPAAPVALRSSMPLRGSEPAGSADATRTEGGGSEHR